MTNAELVERLIHNLRTVAAAGQAAPAPEQLSQAQNELNTVVEKTLISSGYHHAVPGLLQRLSRFLANDQRLFAMDLETRPEYDPLIRQLEQQRNTLEEELSFLDQDSEIIFPGQTFTAGEYVREVLDDIASEAEKIKACATVLEAKIKFAG